MSSDRLIDEICDLMQQCTDLQKKTIRIKQMSTQELYDLREDWKQAHEDFTDYYDRERGAVFTP